MPRTAVQIARERARARSAFRELSPTERWALNDQLVLDDFDWRDWFTSPPSAVFMNELANQLMYWEESQ